MIFLITGPAKSGKTMIANALRNHQINYKKGALIVDDYTAGDPRFLLEKLIDGDRLQPDGAEKQAWKNECAVILVGENGALALEAFEELCPGFKDYHAPTLTIQCGREEA